MTYRTPYRRIESQLVQAWRWSMIALTALLLCSCRSARQTCDPSGRGTLSSMPPGAVGLPPEAFTGAPPPGYTPPINPPLPGYERGVPLPHDPIGAWAPAGLALPWPMDEYVRDGGDAGIPAEVAKDWEVRGLEIEDTVAHYDTLAGKTIVEPSNRVYLYAPRFGAVRQVTNLVANEQHQNIKRLHQPEGLVLVNDLTPVAHSKQQEQLETQLLSRPPIVLERKLGEGEVSARTGMAAVQDKLLPYENFTIIRTGLYQSSELAMLMESAVAAKTWESSEAVQIILDRKAAMVDKQVEQVGSVYTSKFTPAPKLRVLKLASTALAEPGDEVWFTIRFDNIGNQVIGNVTILDNLSPRLEVDEQSAQCSLEAKFLFQLNEAGSKILRCEVTNPLEAGKGGVIRFRCKVR